MPPTPRRPRRALQLAVNAVLRSDVAVATRRPVVGLTFDDGPDPLVTPRLLDLLGSRGARATFFVVGLRVRAHPGLVARAVAEGHEIAVHGHTHRRLPDLGAWGQLRDLATARRSTRAVAGARPRRYRPPYGEQRPSTVLLAKALRLRGAMWTASAHDWKDELDEAAQLARVWPDLTAGGVLLLHDAAAGEPARDVDPDRVLRLVTGVLDGLAERQLSAVSLAELAQAGPAVTEPWFDRWLHG